MFRWRAMGSTAQPPATMGRWWWWWNDRLVEEAVRIERLVESLRAMQAGPKRAIAYIDKLAGG